MQASSNVQPCGEVSQALLRDCIITHKVFFDTASQSDSWDIGHNKG